MNKILEKDFFSKDVFKLVVEAPDIAKARQAGHFGRDAGSTNHYLAAQGRHKLQQRIFFTDV